MDLVSQAPRPRGRGRPLFADSVRHPIFCLNRAHAKGGCNLRKDVFLPSKHLLSAFYKTLPSKNPSENLSLLKTLQAPSKNPSKNPSKKPLLLENLLRTLLRSVLLHEPLGVHPTSGSSRVARRGCFRRRGLPSWTFFFLQHQPLGNNYNPNRHLMQHLCCSCVVALLSASGNAL